MSEREYREEADNLLVLMQTDSISYQEYTRKQSKLVDRFYSKEAPIHANGICDHMKPVNECPICHH